MATSTVPRDTALRRFARLGGALGAAAGALALLGWGLGFPFLASLGAGKYPMAPVTALLFVLYGIAVLLRAPPSPLSARAYWMGVVVNSVGALIALLLLLLSVLGIRLEAEHLGFQAAGTVGGLLIGHVSTVTAVCFLLVSLSFLASLPSAASRPWHASIAWWTAGVLLVTCFVLLLAYLYGTPLFYGGSFIPPAATTSLAFAALGIALLALAELQISPRSDLARTDPRPSYRLLLAFVLLAVGIVTVGGLQYQDYAKRRHAEMAQRISTIAALKVDELVQFRRERLGDGRLFENAAFSALVRHAFDNPGDREAHAELRTWLRKYREHDQYDRVYLLDAQGVEQMATPEGRAPVNSVIAQRAPEILRSGEVVFQDFHRNEHDQKVYLTVLVPMLDGPDGRRALGVLGLRIDPETYLYPFLRRWPTPNRTAETLLVRRDGNDALFLNDLKFEGHTALALRIPLASQDVPAVKAALGQEGIVEGRDYRGVPVVAAVRAVPGSPWYLVARMDVSEVDAPLGQRLGVTIVLVGGLLLGTGVGLGLVWRQQNLRFREVRYRTETALGESRALLEAIVNATPDGVYAKDIEGRYLLVNPVVERFSGKSRAAALGRDDTFLFAPAEAAAVMKADRKVMDAGAVMTFEQIVTDAGGTVRTILSTRGPLFDASGTLIGLFGVSRDITARKRAEERHRLQVAALEAAANAILLTDREGRVEWANAAFAALSGYSLEEVVGRNPRELIRSGRHDRAFYAAMWDRILDGRVWSGEVVNRRKDGTLYEEEMTITPVRDEAGAITHFVAIQQDVTERNRVTEALHHSERHFRALIEHALDVTVVLGPDGCFRYASPSIQRLTGDDRAEDLIGTSALDRLHPDDLPAIQRLLSAAATVPGFTASMEFRFMRRDGAWLSFEAIARNLLQDPAVNGIIVNARDITERRRIDAQQHRLQAQLAQSEKLAAMGQLLAGVAHELNNPLSVVIGHTALLGRTTDAAIAARAQKIGTAAARCGRIVKNFLALARQHEPERQTMELNRVIGDVVELLAYELRVDDVEVVATLAADLPAIAADPHQLQQVVVNLMTNAHQAMRQAPRPRRLTLVTRRGAGADRVCLEVEDSGPGISPEVEAHLFEPFFTTKPVGQGTGLGLSLCKGIVEAHGGTIAVESRPGRGARFTVELPVGTLVPAPATDDHEIPAPGGLAILVVDDEPEVAELIAEMVAGEGCRVATVSNGREALGALARATFDVVISDLKMPEMDGVELYREIAQRYPALLGHVVFTTGDTLSPSSAAFLQETGAPSVRKPFSPAELRSAVHAARKGSPP